MKREKHGHYDPQKKLPDNRMQPAGSGTDVWLQQEVLKLIGEEEGKPLLELARQQGNNRYKWLIFAMSQRGHADLAEEYKRRKRADAVELNKRQHRAFLAGCEEQLKDPALPPQRRTWLEKRAAKHRKYLEERGG